VDWLSNDSRFKFFLAERGKLARSQIAEILGASSQGSVWKETTVLRDTDKYTPTWRMLRADRAAEAKHSSFKKLGTPRHRILDRFYAGCVWCKAVVVKITEVKSLQNYKLFLRFNDGVSGIVDLSDMAGRGVFEAWTQDRVFEQVRITELGALEWPGELDLCADALYLKLTGKQPEIFFPLCASM